MEENGFPSSTRLLNGIRGRLRELSPKIDDKEIQWALQAIDVSLNELVLREDSEFYVSFYSSLKDCLQQGAKLTSDDEHHEDLKTLLERLPPSLDSAMSYSAMTEVINEGLACGLRLMRAVQDAPSAEGLQWIKNLTEVESRLHSYRTEQAEPPIAGEELHTPPTQTALADYIKQRLADKADMQLASYNRLVGGFQKYTILFDTQDSSGDKESCVMRAERNERFMEFDAGDVVSEYEVVSILHDAGVKVAEPLWLEQDAEKLGRRFFVSRLVEGENYGSAMQLSHTLSDKALSSLVFAMASYHQVSLTGRVKASPLGHWLDHQSMIENTRAAVESYTKQPYRQIAYASPIYERVYQWLLDNAPQEELSPSLLHVDYGLHNILLKDDEVTAVLDWESARIGDPAEDVSYFIKLMHGQADPEKILNYYQEATGNTISEYRLRYFDVYNLMKIYSSCVYTAAMFQKEKHAQVEWSLLALPYSYGPVSQFEDAINMAENLKALN